MVGGWFLILWPQGRQSGHTSVPASSAWWRETRWPSPSCLEASVMPSELSKLTVGPALVVQSLRSTEMSPRPLQESYLAMAIY